jgi:hypothetical protein
MRGCKTGKRASIIVGDKSIMVALGLQCSCNVAATGINRPCGKLAVITLSSPNESNFKEFMIYYSGLEIPSLRKLL